MAVLTSNCVELHYVCLCSSVSIKTQPVVLTDARFIDFRFVLLTFYQDMLSSQNDFDPDFFKYFRSCNLVQITVDYARVSNVVYDM